MKAEEILEHLIAAEIEKKEAEIRFFRIAREGRNDFALEEANKYDTAKENYDKIHKIALEYVKGRLK